LPRPFSKCRLGLPAMRHFRTWLIAQFAKLLLMPDYFRALAKEWLNILFGETLVGIGFLVWWALGAPTNHSLIVVFVIAMFVAGYYAWRAVYIRLQPKFKVEKIIAQRTETENSSVMKIYLQVLPECLTDAPVKKCHGRLLLVSQRNNRGEWVPTEMNSPLKLGWDYYGYEPLTIEPGIGQRLNVCFWDNNATAIIPTVDPMPSKWRSIIGPGPFKFDIRMTGKDCKPVDVSVTVNLLGRKWDEPEYALIQGAKSAN
jgi:hypothetical protein